jgi:hypothetical protein
MASALYNTLLEAGQTIPELLPPLLEHFARDAVISVRVSVLPRLPYLLHRHPDFGWKLFAEAFRERQTHLWTQAEQCLYYTYHKHFPRVQPFLDRIIEEAAEEAGETWGRIATLASLSGHMDRRQLLEKVATSNLAIRKGAAQVYCANIALSEYREFCHTGLLKLLHSGEVNGDLLQTIECAFDSAPGHVHAEIAVAFLQKIHLGGEHYSPYHFLEWLASEARRDPVAALPLTEALLEQLERNHRLQRLWHSQPLLITLVEILREADESDDATLIRRAIQLQDGFLRLELNGLEALFEQASRN